MSLASKEQMRWILFWVFVSIFAIVSLLTILAVFFGLGAPSEEERKTLLYAFIVESGAAVIALFYSLFSLKGKLDSEAKDVNAQVEEHFSNISKDMDERISNCTTGVLMVQADVEILESNYTDAAISYIHALSNSIDSNDASLGQEIVSLFKTKIFPNLRAQDALNCRELKSDLKDLVKKLRENNQSKEFDNFMRELSDYLVTDVQKLD